MPHRSAISEGDFNELFPVSEEEFRFDDVTLLADPTRTLHGAVVFDGSLAADGDFTSFLDGVNLEGHPLLPCPLEGLDLLGMEG